MQFELQMAHPCQTNILRIPPRYKSLIKAKFSSLDPSKSVNFFWVTRRSIFMQLTKCSESTTFSSSSFLSLFSMTWFFNRLRNVRPTFSEINIKNAITYNLRKASGEINNKFLNARITQIHFGRLIIIC